MLKTHKDAIAEIKSAQQRVTKAEEEHEKLKAKLKKAQFRLAMEKAGGWVAMLDPVR